MAETSDQQSDDAGFTGFSQEDIDALLNGNDSGASTSTDTPDASASAASGNAASTPEGAADGGAMDQSDIDALLNGGDTDAAADTAPESAAMADMGQAEIDRLLAGDDAAPQPADEPAAPAEDARVDSLGRPFDEAAAAMQAAIDEENAAKAASGGSGAPAIEPESLDLPDLGDGSNSEPGSSRLTMLSDVKLRVRIQLGKTRMLVEDVLKLNEGSVVELDKLAGDPVDVIINDRLIARGEVLVLNDNFCIRICEVLSNDPHRITT
ncbi:MAG: flagellar motor switch protein FliN [Phycisphaerae bacterium]